MTRLFVALLALLLVAGCGAGGAERDTMTESAAYDRVETHVRRAASALPDAASLESAAAPASLACAGEPSGRVRVTTSYWVRGVAVDDASFDGMLTWWEGHGFELLDDLRPERHYVWVRNTTDGFRMSLRANDNGELLLGAESPCLTAG